MTSPTSPARRTAIAAVAAGVCAAALVGTGLGTAPSANATCASIFGIGNGGGCTSSIFGAAIAIGDGATANADGLFGAAIALGTNAVAQTGDAFTFATALGNSANAVADGLFGIATQVGSNGTASTQGSGTLGNLGLNIAFNLSPRSLGNTVTTVGIGNLAANLFGRSTSPGLHSVSSQGTLDIALNVGGDDNTVSLSLIHI